VNSIYDKYSATAKSGANVIKEVANGLVLEFNRRFGIYYKEEISEWRASKKRHLAKRGDLLEDTTDYAFLPNEGEPEYPKPSPSDKFINASTSSTSKTYDRLKNLDDYSLIKTFRDRVISKLRISDSDAANLSLRETFKQLNDIMKSVSTNEYKIKVLHEALNSYGNVVGSTTSKSVSLHELVVTPLYD